jgi:hypothetical protein
MAAKIWKYAIVGCDPTSLPRYLGFAETQQEAIEFLKNTERLGWQMVAVFDAALQELPKRKTPKDHLHEHM